MSILKTTLVLKIRLKYKPLLAKEPLRHQNSLVTGERKKNNNNLLNKVGEEWQGKIK